MSFVTNGKSLRLGYSTQWSTQQLAVPEQDQLANKIRIYLATFLYDSAWDNSKFVKDTKNEIPLYFFDKEINHTYLRLEHIINRINPKVGVYRERLVSRLMMGRILVQRKNNYTKIYVHYFLDLLHATMDYEKRFAQRIAQFRQNLSRWIDGDINILLFNSYLFIWEFDLYVRPRALLKRNTRRVLKLIREAERKNKLQRGFYRNYRRYYSRYKSFFKSYRKKFKRRFKRERYYHTTGRVFLLLFLIPFDIHMLVNIIAQELGRLRVNHKKYIKFVLRTLSFAFRKQPFSKLRRIRGLQLVIKGQLTKFKRRMKRSRSLRVIFGNYRRNDLRMPTLFAYEQALNRFGVIGVSATVQLNYNFGKSFYLIHSHKKLHGLFSYFERNLRTFFQFEARERLRKLNQNILNSLDLDISRKAISLEKGYRFFSGFNNFPSIFYKQPRPWKKRRSFKFHKYPGSNSNLGSIKKFPFKFARY